MSVTEVRNLGWGCPSSYGLCSNIPTWAINSRYWLKSASTSGLIWAIKNDTNYNLYRQEYNVYDDAGARAVVNIPQELFK